MEVLNKDAIKASFTQAISTNLGHRDEYVRALRPLLGTTKGSEPSHDPGIENQGQWGQKTLAGSLRKQSYSNTPICTVNHFVREISCTNWHMSTEQTPRQATDCSKCSMCTMCLVEWPAVPEGMGSVTGGATVWMQWGQTSLRAC